MSTTISHYYRPSPPLPPATIDQLNSLLSKPILTGVKRETCFNAEHTQLTADAKSKLEWLISETFDRASTTTSPKLLPAPDTVVVEFGPRLTFCTAFSSNACSIFEHCDLLDISRFEKSIRYGFVSSEPLPEDAVRVLKAAMHDRMTEVRFGSCPFWVRATPNMYH